MSGISASVVMATYNQAAYLGEALESLLGQTFPGSRFEVIVINDGSTDETAAILSGYRARVRLIGHENRGLVACCNEGLAAARGRYFARLDSDDLADPEWLGLLVEALADRPSACAAVPDRWELYPSGRRHVAADCANVYSLEACGTLFRTEALRRIGGFRDFFWEEYDLYLRLQKIGGFIKVDRPLYIYRKHARGMTADARRRHAGWRQLIEEWGAGALSAAGHDPELHALLEGGLEDGSQRGRTHGHPKSRRDRERGG